jgi:hypothetical protein
VKEYFVSVNEILGEKRESDSLANRDTRSGREGSKDSLDGLELNRYRGWGEGFCIFGILYYFI